MLVQHKRAEECRPTCRVSPITSCFRQPAPCYPRYALCQGRDIFGALPFHFLDQRAQCLEAQPGAQRLDAEHIARLNVAQAHVRPEAQDEVFLLILERSLPDQTIEVTVERRGDDIHVLLVDAAVFAVHSHAFAGLARFDDDPGCARFEVGQGLLGVDRFGNSRLPL